MGKMIFLGVEGAGKSSLTAALALYFLKRPELGWTLRPENREALRFSERATILFDNGTMPAQTARFRRLEWSMCYNNEPYRSLEVLDYPGEVYRLAFLDPDDDPNPSTLKIRQTTYAAEIRELLDYVAKAGQIIFLFDLDDATNLATNDDNLNAVWVTVAALKILSALPSKPQISLLLSQADRLRESGCDLADPKALLARTAPIIAQHCPDVDVGVISSLEPEDESCGFKALLRMIVEKTSLYEKSVKHWDETDAVNLARPFAWLYPKAQFAAHEGAEWDAFVAAKSAADEIANQHVSFKKKLTDLDKLLNETQSARGKDYVSDVRKQVESDRQAYICGIVFVIISFFIIFVIPVLASLCAAPK